ncbi:trypsin beta-like [Eurosta solidaginis]|uniref:trypsin beta-like n=1 Tax=Eurosta solidaginis TaxID=178769 RepID=UPI0035314D9F
MQMHGSLTLIFVISSVFSLSRAEERIVGGTVTQIASSPYIVSMSNNGVYYCAGTLLSMQHLITAANCVVGVPIAQILVKAGRTNLNETGRQSRRVIQSFYPKTYNAKTRFMDIGGMKLQIPFNPTQRVGFAPRCSSSLAVGTQLRVSGWGSTNEGSTTSVANLQSVSVPIVNLQNCANQYQTVMIGIPTTSLCAGNGNGDACSLDTGGPGIVNGQLCAVVSFGFGCNRPNFPGVYTNLMNAEVQRFVTNFLAL